MGFPSEIPVMILTNATLFPQAFLPLRIFEPRYVRMLEDSLHSHRLFAVAMQKPGRQQEIPCPVAGLGLVRASVTAADGTSSLVLQGLARIELAAVVRYRPYRVHRVRLLVSSVQNRLAADALTARVLELVAERLKPAPRPAEPGTGSSGADPAAAPGGDPVPGLEVFPDLTHLDHPEEVADLISWTLLGDPLQRQVLLETLDVELRLRRLIRFLMAGAAGATSN
jgi:ATP-dependent Lon protease